MGYDEKSLPKRERIGTLMRGDRFLMLFAVCTLLLTVLLSETARADLDDTGSLILKGVEKMADSSSDPLKAPGRDILFTPVSDGIITMDTFNGSAWFRISMKDLIRASENLLFSQKDEAVLMFDSSHIAQVDCFLPDTPSTYARYTFGRNSGNTPQFLYTRYPVLWLPPLEDFFSDGYVYLNVRADYPVSAKLHLLTPVSFIRFFFKSLVIQLGFIGFMLSFFIMYFLFYMMTGEKTYRTIMLLQLGTTLFTASFNGHLHAYLKLPILVSSFMTCAAFGLINLVGTYFFHRELRDRLRVHRAYGLALYLQPVLILMMLAACVRGASFCVFASALASFLLSFTGCLLLFVSMLLKKGPRRSPFLYFGSHFAFSIGIIGMVAGIYYTPYWSRYLSYPDFGYMAFLVLSPLLLVWKLLSGSRVRFDNYNRLKAQSYQYKELSQRDGLTGLYNRAYLDHTLAGCLRQAQETGKSLAFIMLDIDHFKRFNDTWGHQEGDRALMLVAKIIRESLREQDVAARYGGEEFSVVLSGAGRSTADIVAERIRKSCMAQSLSLGEGKNLTVSLGISFFRPGDTPEDLIRRADEALYRGKKSGRNRTERESADTPPVSYPTPDP